MSKVIVNIASFLPWSGLPWPLGEIWLNWFVRQTNTVSDGYSVLPIRGYTKRFAGEVYCWEWPWNDRCGFRYSYDLRPRNKNPRRAHLPDIAFFPGRGATLCMVRQLRGERNLPAVIHLPSFDTVGDWLEVSPGLGMNGLLLIENVKRGEIINPLVLDTHHSRRDPREDEVRGASLGPWSLWWPELLEFGKVAMIDIHFRDIATWNLALTNHTDSPEYQMLRMAARLGWHGIARVELGFGLKNNADPLRLLDQIKKTALWVQKHLNY